MAIQFLLATCWSVLCSTLGGLCATAITSACPHCTPVLNCPALSCHCGGGSALEGRSQPTTCSAASGCQWQLIAAAFAAGLATAALGIVGFLLWVHGAPAPLAAVAPASAAAAKGTVEVLGAAAIADVAGVSPRRPPLPLPAVAAQPVSRAPLPGAVAPPASSPHDETPVWKPRR